MWVIKYISNSTLCLIALTLDLLNRCMVDKNIYMIKSIKISDEQTILIVKLFWGTACPFLWTGNECVQEYIMQRTKNKIQQLNNTNKQTAFYRYSSVDNMVWCIKFEACTVQLMFPPFKTRRWSGGLRQESGWWEH